MKHGNHNYEAIEEEDDPGETIPHTTKTSSQKKRGKGKVWSRIETFPSEIEALEEYVNIATKKEGLMRKANKSMDGMCHYFNCKFQSSGCSFSSRVEYCSTSSEVFLETT